MAFSINEMKSQIKYGLTRPNLYQVQITNPANSAGDSVLRFMCEATQIPDSRLGSISVPFFGRHIKLAGDRSFAPWSVQIINDEDFLIRNAMEEWSNAINKHEQNLRVLEDYKSVAQVIQYSKTGEIIRTYEFVGIFPVDISNISLNWGPQDAYESFQVTFDYDYWRIADNATGNMGGE